MNSTQKTIAFLRTLTLDGFLTSDEVWALATHFNENPECATSWPGDLLAPMLGSAFDDGALTEEEMTLLAETISHIEQEWLARNPGQGETDACTEPVVAHPALLPVIDLRLEVPSQREADSFVVALRSHSCTCPDWSGRKHLPARHPGRCCKHMAYAFARSGKVFEPWFQALLDDCFAYGRGTNPSTEWLLVQIPDAKPALVAGGDGPWWTVFAPSEEGYQSFAYNAPLQRWTFGDMPKRAAIIERAVRDCQGMQNQGGELYDSKAIPAG